MSIHANSPGQFRHLKKNNMNKVTVEFIMRNKQSNSETESTARKLCTGRHIESTASTSCCPQNNFAQKSFLLFSPCFQKVRIFFNVYLFVTEIIGWFQCFLLYAHDKKTWTIWFYWLKMWRIYPDIKDSLLQRHAIRSECENSQTRAFFSMVCFRAFFVLLLLNLKEIFKHVVFW